MDPLERLRAAVADRYRVEREVGAGGMATVYLAADLKHDRKVALKVLKPELAAVLGAERFVVEIKTTAALQHPHILPLFDSGEADGFLYYVMPFIDGETLRSKLDRETQLGIDESVKIASAVADALDYAHRHGVIHRDIKPENILLHDGRPVVADFGIALAVSAAAGGRMTETGLSLGTPHYMSPEQATAEKEITGRSDIYSLGSVLYEMLTGNPPHTGASAQQIIMKIVTEEAAPVTKVRRAVPPNVAAAVAKSLEKMPADRFATAEAFRAALNDPHFTAVTAGRAPASGPGWLRGGTRVAMVLPAVALVAGAIGWLARGRGAPPAAAAPITFTTSLGVPGRDEPFISISRDGRKILQAVSDTAGVRRLAIRDIGSNTLTAIPGTEQARAGEFSPDGEWIAFVFDGKLRKIAVQGGPATTVVDGMKVDGEGVAWTRGGDLIFSGRNTGLWRVPSTGGTPVQLTHLNPKRREFGHWAPRMLPGDRAVIFTNFGAQPRVEAYDFKSGKRVVLAEDALFGRYAPSGQLLYARDAAVFAVDFDADKLETHGTAVPVQDDVVWEETNGIAGFDVSPTGTFVFLRDSEWSGARTVVWRTRDGHDTPAIETPGTYSEPRLSPDGRWIALTVQKPKLDLFLYDLSRKVLTQLTRAPGAAFNAVWLPDSKRILYTFEAPVYDLHVIATDGSGEDHTVVSSGYDKYASSVSSDGRRILFSEENKVWEAAMDGGAPPVRWPESALDQRLAVFSPDGRWIAYSELNGARSDIYIRSASGDGGRRLVSAGGGVQPRWTKGGREIVYVTGTAMMSVAVDPATGTAATPTELFKVTDLIEAMDSRTHLYDVTPDGQRFLVVKSAARAAAQPLVVMLNWKPNLGRKTE